MHILTGEHVPAGTSGGVTPAGLLGSAGGSVLIGILAGVVQQTRRPVAHALAVTVAGMAGSLMDSVVGAALQASYRCPRCDRLTERHVHRCGTPTELIRGYSWVTNDLVNVICTATGAAGAALLTARPRE
jgi:uncharacterized membrane protein